MATTPTPPLVNPNSTFQNTVNTPGTTPPVNGVNTGTQSTGGSSAADTSSFIGQLQQKLLGQSDIISSENTNLENKINSAISSVQQGQQASAQQIGLNYDQQIQQAQDTGGSKLTSALELQRGFATNVAGLKQLAQDTDKQVQSLESQKQQLILQGQASAAQQVSNLQLQAIQFQQQAQQQVFSNLLGIGGFAQQQQQNDLSKQNQDFTQQQAMTSIALKYGLTVGPNDTLASLTTKAMPFASQEEQLQLQQLQTQISLNKAQTQKALSDASAGSPLSQDQIWSIANASITQPAVLGLLKTPADAAAVINTASGIQYTNYVTQATGLQQQNVNKSGAQYQVNSDQTLTPIEKAAALKAIDQVYGADTVQPSGTTGLKFTVPGSKQAFLAPQPINLPKASPLDIQALTNSLKGTAFGK